MLDHVLFPPSMTHTQDLQGNSGTVKKEDTPHVGETGFCQGSQRLTKPLGKQLGESGMR